MFVRPDPHSFSSVGATTRSDSEEQPLPILPVDPSTADDDASQVDLAALVADRLDITKLYRALAKRHDELVVAVERKLQGQAR